MTHDDFITIVRQPEIVKPEYETDLKEFVERYPYFVPARLLYIKALQQSRNIHYGANLKLAAIYCSSRRSFYYYLHPEKLPSTEPYQRNKNGKSSGDYFEMINMIESEGGDTKQSLKDLAERLKSARAMVVNQKVQPKKNSGIIKEFEDLRITKENESLKSIPETNNQILTIEISENNAKKLIKEHKYREAIEILTALNLNNPKKSVYFADQIRFLEKVIANSKK
jgi:hypothetical protein